MKEKIEIKLNSTEHGYKDYDVVHKEIKRAKVPYNLKKGDVFNVYFLGGRKEGCEYDGKSVLTSLEELLSKLKISNS